MSADVLVIYHHIIAGAQESLDTTANTHFMFWSETNLTKCIVALAAAVRALRELSAGQDEVLTVNAQVMLEWEAEMRALQARVETTTWYNGTLLTEPSALRMRAAELETILKKQHDAEIIMM
jgi:hypothetical protein